MPSPPTTKLPRPRSWDEFEDICADVLKRLWGDPYVVRNARSGQKQHGVDIYGQPEHLRALRDATYSGAQCKLANELHIDTIRKEVAEASAGFRPELKEFLMMTSAPRDGSLQEQVRTETWPFEVRVMFWEDISLELSGHEDLLRKHFPGWMQKTTSKDEVLRVLLEADPGDFDYDDDTGVYVYNRDVQLRVVLERGPESDEEFVEPWVTSYPDKRAMRQPIYVYYGGSKIHTMMCARVDGSRHIIPLPSGQHNLTIDRFQYHAGQIINRPLRGYGFDSGLQRAGIEVTSE